MAIGSPNSAYHDILENPRLYQEVKAFSLRFMRLIVDNFHVPKRVRKIVEDYEAGDFREYYEAVRLAPEGVSRFKGGVLPDFFPIPLAMYEPWRGYRYPSAFRMLFNILCQRVLYDYSGSLKYYFADHFYDPVGLIEHNWATCLCKWWLTWESITYKSKYTEYNGLFAIFVYYAMQAACDTLLEGEYEPVVTGAYDNGGEYRRWSPVVYIQDSQLCCDKYVGIQRKGVT